MKRMSGSGSPDCDAVMESISARLDGEEGRVTSARIERHVETCPGCRRFLEDAVRLNRLLRLAPAPEVPDRTPEILRATGPARPSRAGSMSRSRRVFEWKAVVAAIAVGKLAVGLPGLVGGLHGGSHEHTLQHVAAFEVALGVGLLLAVWQPVRAVGLVPLLGVLAVFLAGGALFDVIAGRAAILAEAPHVLDLAAAAAVWRLGASASAAVAWRAQV
ncbi:MAG: hypothetical protein KatS3mg008_1703 [Acidimicrobiales bacterium]|nr:MAG: hypothetical protein KatS3mg008_1703 [Acidimicrobiales bacterium]